MSEKEYSNEMRGTLWPVDESDRKENGPAATGTVTISGVELRIAMWPARVAGGTGKGAGKKYCSLSLEYKQGTKAFLAKCNPANVLVTGATAETAPADEQAPEGVDSIPF